MAKRKRTKEQTTIYKTLHITCGSDGQFLLFDLLKLKKKNAYRLSYELCFT